MSIEAMKMALEFIDANADGADERDIALAIRQAIEQAQKQEPLCTAAMFDDAFLAKSGLSPDTKLYTSPPQRQPLTDDEILEILCIHLDEGDDIEDWRNEINEARAIEAKLKEKNGKPPQRQPLTDEQIEKIFGVHNDGGDYYALHWERDITRAIEAAHGIKGEA